MAELYLLEGNGIEACKNILIYTNQSLVDVSLHTFV